MDMQRMESLMIAMRKANECEAAAEMDVKDVEGCIAIYQEKLKAAQCKHAETQRAADEASKRAAHEMALQTRAPLRATMND